MPSISILTYNILSQKLADLMINEEKDGKKVYDNSYMNESYRWNKISNLIETNIIESVTNTDTDTDTDTKTGINYLVICLQEVTEDWIPKFSQLFIKLNYAYINVQHGRVFNGNMGL